LYAKLQHQRTVRDNTLPQVLPLWRRTAKDKSGVVHCPVIMPEIVQMHVAYRLRWRNIRFLGCLRGMVAGHYRQDAPGAEQMTAIWPNGDILYCFLVAHLYHGG
jgi:hypothetical protein